MWAYWKTHKEKWQDIFVLCAAILGSILFFRYLFPIVLPFLIGWLLSKCFLPLARRLEAWHVPKWCAALLCILLLLGMISLFGALIGNQIVAQAKNLMAQMPHYIEALRRAMNTFWLWVDTKLVDLPDVVQNAIAQAKSNLTSILLGIVQNKGSAPLTSVPNFLLGMIASLLSVYFFIKDRDGIHKIYEKYVVTLFGKGLDRTKRELKASLWGYVKTQLILMIYTFGITLIGLSILHSPFALLLAVSIAIIDALPFFGSGFILWPGALIHLILGDPKMAIGYLVIYGAVQIMRQIMQPKILGTQIGLHPLLTLFAMYFGYRSIGFWGLILGPVLAVLLKAYFQTRQKTCSISENTEEKRKDETYGKDLS